MNTAMLTTGDLYLRAIESPGASGYFIAASGDNPTVR